MRADEELYRALLTNLSCVTYRCANDERWTADFVSEACLQLTGYPAADFIHNPKRSLASLVAPDDRERVQAQLQEAIAQQQAYFIEYRIIHADGSERWVAERGQVMAAGAGLDGWRIGALFDISEQKQREASLLRTNQELMETSRLTGKFLANVSHEIRTPLSVILTIAESLQEGIYGPPTVRQKEALGRLRRSGRHLLGLMNDILDMAKLEVGKLALHTEQLSVHTLCNQSLQMLQELAQMKSIKLSYVQQEMVDTLWADEQRLRQILVNLLTNAIKFTPEGGRVGLEVTVEPEQEIIYFTVWDTGIGMAAADTAKLFQPFVQLDNKLSRHYEGTGLGLALVYHLIRLHGGGIRLETDEGQGSRFTIALPWRMQEEAVANPATSGTTITDPTGAEPVAYAPHRPPCHKAHILLVGEEETELQQVAGRLKTQGWTVSIVTSLRSALKLVSEEAPDLVLLDTPMPDFKMVEMAHQLRTRMTYPTTPIIAVTTLTVPGYQSLWRQAGITLPLLKPISEKHLIAAIHAQLATP